MYDVSVHDVSCSLPAVDGGERAVIFDRFRGVLPKVSGEGTHFLVPWVQRPIIFSIRSKPRRVPVVTGSKGLLCWYYTSISLSPSLPPSLYPSLCVEYNDPPILCLSCFFVDLQNVDITLRILFRPQPNRLPWLYTNVGVDYEERILPSITTEVLKAVVVCLHCSCTLSVVDDIQSCHCNNECDLPSL